jgi:hypothetical protein
VYYVPEVDTEWAAAVQSIPSGSYNLDNLEIEHTDNDNGQVMPSVNDLSGTVTVDIINGVIPSIRTDIDGIIVDKKI